MEVVRSGPPPVAGRASRGGRPAAARQPGSPLPRSPRAPDGGPPPSRGPAAHPRPRRPPGMRRRWLSPRRTASATPRRATRAASRSGSTFGYSRRTGSHPSSRHALVTTTGPDAAGLAVGRLVTGRGEPQSAVGPLGVHAGRRAAPTSGSISAPSAGRPRAWPAPGSSPGSVARRARPPPRPPPGPAAAAGRSARERFRRAAVGVQPRKISMRSPRRTGPPCRGRCRGRRT